MRMIIFICLLLYGYSAKANMSSPIQEGTMTSTGFSSKDIDILFETINIKIDKDFRTAKFVIEYTIKSERSGKQIPLLFYAEDYKDGFFVWVDNQKVDVLYLPEGYNHNNHNFPDSANENRNDVLIYWQPNIGYHYRYEDLKYFEVDIDEGIHKIRVEYTSNTWIDLWGWVKKYSFRYSLTPAKHWKSFGTLDISIEFESLPESISTNLGKPIENEIKTFSSWSFKELPDEYRLT